MMIERLGLENFWWRTGTDGTEVNGDSGPRDWHGGNGRVQKRAVIFDVIDALRENP